ncbi:50S ribosomal protein L20 [Candidatus Nesciobacter abundans]|uniref:Large ribosomal subunit protein bL20 n=1 Tax=Candidatus Nesciobacter abundans TaxID=2601668 RepID=A0A5C0UG45_9PROT|nr:50S ribosomal protein L20 [Candidatus Nesciobacter abundans]QEK39028.1 50S ribosomal protein L20 [Candidatus Nesciobacter abundans]
MTRIKRGVTKHARHKKILDQTKGYVGRSKNCYRIARNRLEKGLQHAYIDRRKKKRNFRSLWIQRINAAVRSLGFNFSTFKHSLKQNNFDINLKALSEFAIKSPETFDSFVMQVMKS